MISLLPYIQSPQEGFLLELSSPGAGAASGPGNPFPFQIADQGGVFSILVKGGLSIKNSQVVKPLFLLVQRDHYPVLPDDLTFMTNADLDRIWLETIRFHASNDSAFHIPGFPEKTPAPFHPLFYCKKEKKFFQPPCPECGEPLSLCRDDDLLKGAGLYPYHASLRRYLHCPRCHEAGEAAAFYQFSRSPEDQVYVKDRFDLVRDFRKLRTKASGDFPCLSCPGHSECYITGEKAGSWIDFFSFYPFYLLFFDAAAVKGVDFIPLLSGSSPEQVPSLSLTMQGSAFKESLGPQKGPWFFFAREKRFFLEVLYLKLTFLEKFIQELDRAVVIPAGLSARSIWITPGARGSMLPFFWNFSLHIIDLASEPSPVHHRMAGNQDLAFLVRLWFYTFLANQDQGPDKVYRIAGDLSGRQPAPPFDDQALIRQFPGLAPGNIFWECRQLSMPEEWHQFWFKALFTGLSLLNPDAGPDLPSCLTGLLSDIKILKEEIQAELFSFQPLAQPSLEPASQSMPEDKEIPGPIQDPLTHDNQAIARMLGNLRARWAKRSPASGPDTEEEDVLETIVLSSGEDEKTGSREAFQEEKPPEPDDFDEKTVVLQGTGNTKKSDFEEMEETVILSPGKVPPAPPEPETGFFGEEDELDQTMIIPPKK